MSLPNAALTVLRLNWLGSVVATNSHGHAKQASQSETGKAKKAVENASWSSKHVC